MNQFRAALRLLLFVLLTAHLFLCGFMISLCYPNWLKKTLPLPPRSRLAGKIMQVHFKAIAWLCGLRVFVETEILKELPKDRALFLCNHVNYLDVIALGSLLPMGFVGKSEVGEWKFIGRVTRYMNTIFVKREDVTSRVRCIRALQMGTRTLPYCVFPQGTTSAAPYLGEEPWHAGQLFCVREPGVRVFAVGLRYQNHEKLAWVDQMTLLPHLWNTLKQKRVWVGVVIKEMPIKEPKRCHLRELSLQVRESINHLTERAENLLTNVIEVTHPILSMNHLREGHHEVSSIS